MPISKNAGSTGGACHAARGKTWEVRAMQHEARHGRRVPCSKRQDTGGARLAPRPCPRARHRPQQDPQPLLLLHHTRSASRPAHPARLPWRAGPRPTGRAASCRPEREHRITALAARPISVSTPGAACHQPDHHRLGCTAHLRQHTRSGLPPAGSSPTRMHGPPPSAHTRSGLPPAGSSPVTVADGPG